MRHVVDRRAGIRNLPGLFLRRRQQCARCALRLRGCLIHLLGCTVDLGNEIAQVVDRIVDGVGNRAGNVLGNLRLDRQVAISQVAHFVQQVKHGLLIAEIGGFDFLEALTFGFSPFAAADHE